MVRSEINVSTLIIICCSYFFLFLPLTLPPVGSIAVAPVPDWEIVSNLNPMVAAALFHEREVRWTTLPEAAVRASMLCCGKTAICRFKVALFMGT